MNRKSINHSANAIVLIAALAIAGPALAKRAYLITRDSHGALDVGVSEQPSAAKGWQGQTTYNVPTGETSLFFHYPCAPSASTPVSGAISPNPAAYGGMSLIGNYNRGNGEWGWLTTWSAGAPAGSQITYDVYCSKK